MKRCFDFSDLDLCERNNREEVDIRFFFLSLDEKALLSLKPYSDLQDSSFFGLETICDPIIAKLCELTGAKFFVNENKKYIIIEDWIGDITEEYYFRRKGAPSLEEYYMEYCKCNKIILNKKEDWKNKQYNNTVIKRYALDREKKVCPIDCNCKKFKNQIGEISIEDLEDGTEIKTRTIGNIFTEYLAFLDNKRNEWEDVKVVLGI